MNFETTTPELKKILESIFNELVNRNENIVIAFSEAATNNDESKYISFTNGTPAFAQHHVIETNKNLKV